MKLEPKVDPTDMQDNDVRRDERKTVAGLELNRKQRRRLAKRNGLFADKSHEAWKIANKHMKGDKQQRIDEHRLGE